MFLSKSLKPTAFVLLTSLGFVSVSAIQPRPAQAFVGVATLNPWIILGGLALGAGSILGAPGIVSLSCSGGNSSHGGCMYGGAGLILAGLFVGLVLLDDQSPAGIQLQVAHPEMARAAGLIDEELTAYNDNLPELNAVAESVAAELQATRNPSVEASSALWHQHGSSIDPAAIEGARKLVRAALVSRG